MQFSDAIIKWLKELGYTHCFFVAGGNIMHLLNSVRNEMTCIPFVNEVGAAIAVEAFNEMRGKESEKAFLLVTAGPGLTNAVTGIAGAWLESRELLVIGGQVKSTDLSDGTIRQRGIQELNGTELVSSITKKSVRLTRPISGNDFADLVSIGISGKKGPIFIEICLDVQAMQVEDLNEPVQLGIKDTNPTDSDLSQLKNLIAAAKRPILLLGGGVSSDFAKSKERILQHLEIPIMTTWNGADRISSLAPNYFGRPNTWGQRYSNIIIQQSDLIVAFGTRLGLQQTGFAWEEFAPLAKIVQIDIDKFELEKGKPKIFLGINADADTTLNELVESQAFSNLEINEWIGYCKEIKSLLPLKEPCNKTSSEHVDPYEFGLQITNVMGKDDVLIPCSSGSSFTVLMQTAQLSKNQRMLSSKGLASMGYGLSTAIGAALSNKEIGVFLVEGDGGLAQNLQEFGTLSATNANVKVFIWANHGYASIRMTQRNYFNGSWIGCDSETGLGLPNWQHIAQAYAIKYVKMGVEIFNNPELMSDLKTNIPMIIEVPIDPEQTFFPKITSSIQSDGSMKSNPLHLMSPELPEDISKKVLKYFYD